MDFKEATDRLLACGLTTREIADSMGFSMNAVARMRVDPSKPSRRRPPPGWQSLLQAVARDRAARMTACADDLMSLADEFDTWQARGRPPP